jgi:hypothetical protein
LLFRVRPGRSGIGRFPVIGVAETNGEVCPLTDLAGRIKEPARMCREPIFSSRATKIPLFDLDQVKGMGQSPRTTLRRLFSGPSTIGTFVFPLYDEAKKPGNTA